MYPLSKIGSCYLSNVCARANVCAHVSVCVCVAALAFKLCEEEVRVVCKSELHGAMVIKVVVVACEDDCLTVRLAPGSGNYSMIVPLKPELQTLGATVTKVVDF